jgi:accessory gene regulator protein AgrB
MNETSSRSNETASRSIGRTILAVLVVVVAAWFLLKFVLGAVLWLASVAAVILAIVAIIWALRVLL